MLKERAYWLLWFLNGILFIFILIPTPIYVSIYREAKEYAQQHCEEISDTFSTLSNSAFWTAAATLAIACFTYMLKRSTDRLWKSTHRPKLVVRELFLFPITPSRSSPGIQYVIANSGAGDAEIVESHRELVLIKDDILWPLQPTEGANPIGSVTLEPGEHISREAGSTIGYAEFANEMHRQLYDANYSTKLFFRSFIIYVDKNKLRRRTAFCRGYDFKRMRFRIVEDPDYEYAD